MPTFLSLTVEAPTAISKAVAGSFSAPKLQEIVAAQGTALALYRISTSGDITQVSFVNAFGLVRDLVPFRLTGLQRDYLAVTSDCGRIVILQFEAGAWQKIHQETFGKTGIRRIVPGQYLCADPKGRALVIGAVEKQKFLYIMNRDNQNRLQISSPLECHCSNRLTFSLCALDVGFENPVFASLEANIADDSDHKNENQRYVCFYEMDLGLNHVVRKCAIPVSPTAETLIPIPAGAEFTDGPGGVLVCCKDEIVFVKPEHEQLRCKLPRRLESPKDTGVTEIITWACHKMKDFHLILIQTCQGDLFQVDIHFDRAKMLKIGVSYFDTIPIASSLCILKTGFLFVASEISDHCLYQFVSIDKSVTLTSDDTEEIPFKPTVLQNLVPISPLLNRAPLTHMKVIDCIRLTQCPQVYTFKGCGANSKLSILNYGLAVNEIAASEVPGKPTGLFTLREKLSDLCHSILLLSFPTATLVMSVTDSIEEMPDTQFATDRATLYAASMADDSLLQITEDGWNLLQPAGDGRRAAQWKPPTGKRVICAASNATQVLLALNGGVLVYFEMDILAGSNSLQEMDVKDLGIELTAVALVASTSDYISGSFGVVAGVDRVIRTLSLKGANRAMWKQLSQYQLPADSYAESLVIAAVANDLILNIGLSTGILLRLPVGLNSGTIGNNKKRKFIGATPVKAVAVESCLDGTNITPGVALLSSKPWLDTGNNLQPLVFGPINAIASLNTEHAPWGYVTVTDNYMKIISVEPNAQNSIFSAVDVPLQLTPRKATIFPPPPTIHERQNAILKGTPIVLLPPSPQRPWLIASIESDHNSFDLATQEELRKNIENIDLPHQPPPVAAAATDGAEGDDNETPINPFAVSADQVGNVRAGDHKWGGCLRLISPVEGILSTIPFGVDESPVSICVCQFTEYPDHPTLVVGTVTGLNLKTRKCIRGGIKIYVYNEANELVLLHETPVEDIPYSLFSWKNRLLAGIGSRLRIYTLGKKRLLKKCEYKNLPLGVNWIDACDNTIFVADIREGFHVLQYDPAENNMRVLADQITTRWITDGELLDPYTVAGVDKFGNFFVLRIPVTSAAAAAATATAPITTKSDLAYLTGKNDKLERLCEYHIGDVATSLVKCQLAFGGAEILLYSTILGAIGAMIPIMTQAEVDVLTHLEMLMRNEDVSIVGRDHMFFRSAVFPVKNVIDGDLLMSYPQLQPDRQSWIAQQMDRQPMEIIRLLEDCRATVF